MQRMSYMNELRKTNCNALVVVSTSLGAKVRSSYS
jgi:hypothetical protein